MEKDIKSLIKEVLDKGYLMSIATSDPGGVWVSDVIYVHDENLNLYWISEVGVRHSEAILKNSKVAGSITAVEKMGEELGLQFEGVAEKVEGSLFEIEKEHRLKRGMEEPQKPGEVLESNQSWYVLKPRKIELINNKLYGFDKKELSIT